MDEWYAADAPIPFIRYSSLPFWFKLLLLLLQVKLLLSNDNPPSENGRKSLKISLKKLDLAIVSPSN